MKENIFTYEGPRGELVDIFYNLLISGEIVSYERILTEYDGGELSSFNVTGHELYKTLKHVVPEVIEAFQNNGFPVLSIPSGRTTSYQYVGSNRDPLKNIRFRAILKERHNILSDCIAHQKPVKISYKPFDKNMMEITFHPHLLYHFNGRHFVFGISEMAGRAPFKRFCMSLDRIEGEIRGSSSAYLPAYPNEYNYLAHLVGVRFEDKAELTTIRLQAHDQYTFGRLVTKPLHDSQIIIEQPNSTKEKEGGMVEINVFPNAELVGQILSYGSLLEVVSPKQFRERVVKELLHTLDLYNSSEA